MRDPNRIDTIIEAVKAEWKQEPDWRLGQLIVNISRAASYEDPFFMEDDRETLDAMLESQKIAKDPKVKALAAEDALEELKKEQMDKI